jgi:hypothetical protein
LQHTYSSGNLAVKQDYLFDFQIIENKAIFRAFSACPATVMRVLSGCINSEQCRSVMIPFLALQKTQLIDFD